jgi:hypothetical protein
MISMGMVWDRTTAVIAGRLGILISITLLLLFAPPVAQAATDAVAGSSQVMRWVGGIVAIVVFLAAMWGALAITAVATDPAVDRGAALTIGSARIAPLFGIIVVLGLVAAVAMLPGVALIGVAGFDVDRARLGLSQDNLDLGMFALGCLYFLVLALACLWIAAKLVPLLGVVVNERRGVRAIGRSFALARGSTLKLIGVLILYSIVFTVVLLALNAVIGLIVRLIVGPEAPAAVGFAVALVTAAVTAGFSVLQSVFSAQFYLAAREARDPA